MSLMAHSGMSVPTYAYAANNPLKYTDPTGKYYWATACSSPTGGMKGDGWEFLDLDTVDVCMDCKTASAKAIACSKYTSKVFDNVDCSCIFELAKAVCAEMHRVLDKYGVCDARLRDKTDRPQDQLACGPGQTE